MATHAGAVPAQRCRIELGLRLGDVEAGRNTRIMALLRDGKVFVMTEPPELRGALVRFGYAGLLGCAVDLFSQPT